MRHEYLETLLKIKQMEEAMGAHIRKIPDVNIKISKRLLKEDEEFAFGKNYIAKTRIKLKKLRKIQKEGMTELEYLEKNKDKYMGMQEREVDNIINAHYISEKQKKERERLKIEEEKQKIKTLNDLKTQLNDEISKIVPERACQYCKKGPRFMDCNMKGCTAENRQNKYPYFVLDYGKFPSIKAIIDAIHRINPDFTL